MSHDRKSRSCKPSHRRRGACATRLPSGWRRSSGSPRPRNASWMTRDRRRSPAQPKRRRTSRPETWRGQSSRSCSKKIQETEQRLAQLQAGLAKVQDAIAGREAAEQARDGAAAELAALRHDVDAARRDLDDAISQASARRGEAAEHLAAGEQARAELLAVQERIRAETRALNGQETQLAMARATASGLQAAEQARDTAKAQLAALQLDADVVTRNLDESRAQAANPPKSAS